jgi:hypothetical protein
VKVLLVECDLIFLSFIFRALRQKRPVLRRRYSASKGEWGNGTPAASGKAAWSQPINDEFDLDLSSRQHSCCRNRHFSFVYLIKNLCHGNLYGIKIYNQELNQRITATLRSAGSSLQSNVKKRRKDRQK